MVEIDFALTESESMPIDAIDFDFGPPETATSVFASGLGDGVIGLRWSDNEVDEDGYRIERRVAGSGDDFETIEILDRSATDYIDESVDTDTIYEYRVVAFYNQFGESDSVPVEVEDDILPPSDLTLDNGIIDEIEISWDPESLTHGEFRAEIVDDETGDMIDDAVVYQDVSSVVFGELLDGQLYDVRLRSETDYEPFESDWVEDDIITKFPAVTDVQVVDVAETSATVEWTDNSDNERGQIVLRQQRVDGEWWPPRDMGDVGPETESFVDGSIQPNRRYRYLISTFTNYASTESEPYEFESDGPQISTDAAPADGWRVEVDREDGKTVVPELRDDPQAQPQINGFPSLRVSTTPDEFWQDTEWDDATIRAWRDGKRQPIDVLEHRDLSTDEMAFEARGGTELDQRVVARSEPVEPVAEFVERLITDETGYDAVVDSAKAQIRENVLLQLADTQADLQSAFEPIPNDVPLAFEDDSIICLETAIVFEADEMSGPASNIERDDFSGGSGVVFTSEQNRLEIPFDLEYETNDLAVYVRFENVDDNTVPLSIFKGDVESDNEVGGIGVGGDLGWVSGSVSGTFGDGDDFLQISYSQDFLDDPGDVEIDAVAVVDDRFDYNFPDELTNGRLDGPELFPDVVKLLLAVIDTPLAISRAALKGSTADGSPLREVALREDGTGDFVAAQESNETTLDYGSLEATVQGRVGIGRREDLEPRDETPRLGYEPQTLDTVELRADLDETPVLINRTFDEQLVGVLREAMDVYDGAFEVREGDPTEIHVSRIDGRPVEIDPELVDYSVDRSTEGAVDRAVVYAASQAIRRLSFEADVDEWTQLPLSDGRIVEGSENVFDAADDDESLERGDDYEIREVVIDGPPEIKLLTSVDEPRIDCDFKPRGEHEAADLPDSPKEIVEDAPELNSQQMADLAAFQAVEGSYTDAVIDATIELPPGELGFEVLDALNVADLPGDEPYQVQDIDVSTERIRVRLGAGKTAGEVVQDINRKTGRVSERV